MPGAPVPAAACCARAGCDVSSCPAAALAEDITVFIPNRVGKLQLPDYENAVYDEYQYQGDPFGGFGFDPFSDLFGTGGMGAETRFRTRNYADPELKTVENHVLAQRYQDALNLLNRIPTHGADWHALYARADMGLGNRISAMDHARKAAQMAPGDPDYQTLLRTVESGRQDYRRTRQTGGYDFRNAACSNPFLICCALNCCLGGCGRYGMWC